LTNYCLKANEPGVAGGAFGFADMGPWQGGQAEFLRVPWADFMCLKLPPDAEEKQSDYVMCADIFPTGWHATGQCPVKAYNRQLRDLIHAGRAKPSFIVSHELKLEQAPDAYQHFDARDHGWTKVIVHPGT